MTKTYAADGVEVHALQGVSPDVEAGFTGSQMEDFFRFVEASGTSILDASRVAGVTIPALCYHPVFMGGPRPPG